MFWFVAKSLHLAMLRSACKHATWQVQAALQMAPDALPNLSEDELTAALSVLGRSSVKVPAATQKALVVRSVQKQLLALASAPSSELLDCLLDTVNPFTQASDQTDLVFNPIKPKVRHITDMGQAGCVKQTHKQPQYIGCHAHA